MHKLKAGISYCPCTYYLQKLLNYWCQNTFVSWISNNRYICFILMDITIEMEFPRRVTYLKGRRSSPNFFVDCYEQYCCRSRTARGMDTTNNKMNCACSECPLWSRGVYQPKQLNANGSTGRGRKRFTIFHWSTNQCFFLLMDGEQYCSYQSTKKFGELRLPFR
jgi:hypothetical protein